MTFPLAGKGNLGGLLTFPSAQTTVIVAIITHTHTTKTHAYKTQTQWWTYKQEYTVRICSLHQCSQRLQ
jgi:hypothetical protein